MNHPVTTSRAQKVIIQVNTPAKDSKGQPVPSWATLPSLPNGVWALEFEQLGGQEVYAAEQIKGDSTARIRIRYMASVPITILHQVIYNGVAYSINAVNDVGAQHQFLDLMVKAAQ